MALGIGVHHSDCSNHIENVKADHLEIATPLLGAEVGFLEKRNFAIDESTFAVRRLLESFFIILFNADAKRAEAVRRMRSHFLGSAPYFEQAFSKEAPLKNASNAFPVVS